MRNDDFLDTLGGVTTNLDMPQQNQQGNVQNSLLSEQDTQSDYQNNYQNDYSNEYQDDFQNDYDNSEFNSANMSPDQYEDFELPDEIDSQDPQVQSALNEAKGVFKQLGLNQQQAQRLIDLHMKHYIGGLSESNDYFEQELNRRVAQWGEQVKKDPELGGANLKASVASVNRAISRLGGRELYNALTNETGVINHPAIFAAFAKIGKMFNEDKFIPGSRSSGRDTSPAGVAARIYPGMVRR